MKKLKFLLLLSTTLCTVVSNLSKLLSIISCTLTDTDMNNFKIVGIYRTPNPYSSISGYQRISYMKSWFPIFGVTYVYRYKRPLLSKYCFYFRLGYGFDTNIGLKKQRYQFRLYLSIFNRFNVRK